MLAVNQCMAIRREQTCMPVPVPVSVPVSVSVSVPVPVPVLHHLRSHTLYVHILFLFFMYVRGLLFASRPLLDSRGRAVLLCHTPKREYLRKLLHEPLPIESHLDHVMAEHMNAEVCAAVPMPMPMPMLNPPISLRCARLGDPMLLRYSATMLILGPFCAIHGYAMQ